MTFDLVHDQPRGALAGGRRAELLIWGGLILSANVFFDALFAQRPIWAASRSIVSLPAFSALALAECDERA